jgi:hypothetical protein
LSSPPCSPVQQGRAQLTPPGAVINDHTVDVQRVVRVVAGEPIRIGLGLDCDRADGFAIASGN